jgi:hypothetical protein
LSKSKTHQAVFRFKKTDHIGAADAEQDLEYLSNCFIDTGDFEVVENFADHRQILLGRAGSGKSALISKLKWTYGEQVISIEPENLALTHISNSTILKFFSDLGVNLDPFFKLLWRHILTVEILTHHFSLHGQKTEISLMDRLGSMFSGTSRKDKEMKEAINYLKNWGEKFWEETEFRVKEIANKVEDSLGGEIVSELGIPKNKLKSVLKAGRKISEEQKSELVNRGQKIISAAQVQDLSKVVNLLDTVLSDKQKKYFVVIDSLDENWVEEKLRYKLIMALILTAKDFFKVKNAKVIVALRRDLIERVFRLTRESGFQEEKYQSLYIPLHWTKKDLINVLDDRISYLVSRRYTKKSVTHKDLLPKLYNKIPITDYIGNITIRPRDIISLFNCCILAASNLSKLSSSIFKNAVGEYSRLRLRALGDEWNSNYPSLLDFTKILHRKPPSFKINTITDKEIEELCLDVAAKNPSGDGLLQQYANQIVNIVLQPSDFKLILAQVFFRVGFIGLKTSSYESETWNDELGRSVSSAEVDEDTSIVIHPMYHRALGINSSN